DVAGVAGGLEAGEQVGVGQRAGAGAAAAGHVGDLDVAEAGAVAVDEGGDVLAHPGQVVEVGEERDVPRAHLVDELVRGGRRGDAVARVVVRVGGLDEHGDAGAGGGL